MKIFSIILKILFVLLIVSPVLGALGVFPPPTPDLYTTPEAYAFIKMLYDTGYVLYVMAAVFAVSIVLIIMNRMALASILVLPITVNIIGFHMFLDGGLFSMGAIMANLLLLINICFLWINRKQYKSLLQKNLR